MGKVHVCRLGDGALPRWICLWLGGTMGNGCVSPRVLGDYGWDEAISKVYMRLPGHDALPRWGWLRLGKAVGKVYASCGMVNGYGLVNLWQIAARALVNCPGGGGYVEQGCGQSPRLAKATNHKPQTPNPKPITIFLNPFNVCMCIFLFFVCIYTHY